MTGEFGQFKPQERGLSDIESVQAPVQEQATPGIVQGVLDFANAGVSAFGTIKGAEAKSAKAKAEQLDIEYSNRYDAALEKVSAAQDSGQMTSAQARTFLRKAKAELITQGASADKLNTTESKTLKTLSGKALAEGTEEERAERAFNDRFAKSNFYDPKATAEEQELNKGKFQQSIVENEAYRLEQRQFDLEENRAKSDTRKRDEIERKRLASQSKYMTNLISQQPTFLSNEVGNLEDIYEDDIAAGMSPAEAVTKFKAALEQQKLSQLGQVRAIAAQTKTGMPIKRELAESNINAYFDNAIKFAGTATYNEEQAAQKERIVLDTSVMLLTEDENTQVLAGMESVVRGAAPLMGDVVAEAAGNAKDIIRQASEREDNNAPPNLGSDSSGTKDYYDLLQNNLKNLGKVGSNGEPVVNVEQISKQVSGVLAYAGDAQGKVDLAEYDKVVAQMATPGFGKFVKDYQGGLNTQDLANAQLALGVYAERVADSVNSILADLETPESLARLKSTNPRGRVMAENVTSAEDLDLVLVNGQVVFRGKTRAAKEKADTLTRKMNGPLTRAINATANISNSTPEQEFNNWLPQLWPSKYGEETTQEEVQTQSVDYSQYEGRTGRDQEGNIVTVRNGVLVKVGGTTDARESR